MTVPEWGLLLIIAALVIWVYLAASQWIDDKERKVK